MADREASFIEIVESKEFIDIWRRVTEESISYREFVELTPPSGCSTDALWTALCILQKNAGVTWSFKPYLFSEAKGAWFFMPKNSQDDIRDIVGRSHEGSALSAFFGDYENNSYVLLPLLLEEIASLATRDGLDIAAANLGGVWLRTRKPCSPQEQVLYNTSLLFSETSEYLHRQISAGLIEEIHERIVKGVGELEAGTRLRFSSTDLNDSYADSDRVLHTIKMLAGGGASTDYVHPIIAGINISSFFWDLAPFPSVNALTEFIVRRIHFFRSGFPALAYCSFSSAFDKWVIGRLPVKPAPPFESLTTDTPVGLNATGYHCLTLRLYKYELIRLDAEVAEIKTEIGAHQEHFLGIPGLNKRQRAFLAVAARNPTAQYAIRDYMALYDVVYATARADLFALVDSGYLTCRTVGRAFVFRFVVTSVRDEEL